MKIWVCTHSGHYIGGASIIVAETRERAEELLVAALEERGIELTYAKFEPFDPTVEGCTVIRDGDY